MQLIEVKDKRTARQFRDVARVLYKNDENWICPPDQILERIFDPHINSFWRHGEAIRWILVNDSHRLIGRVAAFINTNKAYTFQQPTGGMGFFECIEDWEAAKVLFDACRDWLKARGMEAMDGPINFGENDVFWGLLVEGFMPQSYGMNYNPPYYKRFFEDYGFSSYFEQVTNHLDLRKPFPERFWKVASWVRGKPEYKFVHFKSAEADRFIRDLKTIYDSAWQFHENFTPIEIDFLKKSLDESKFFLVEEFIWFVYHEKEPAAFLVMLPDLNQMLKPLNGRLNWWGKLRLFYYLKTRKFTRARVSIMGVTPRYQRNGLEAGIFWNMDQVVQKMPWYNELELSWVGDYNLKMRALHESVGGYFAKRHITYRKNFSEIPVEQRSSFIPIDTKDQFIKGS
jgi:hypothetical protein